MRNGGYPAFFLFFIEPAQPQLLGVDLGAGSATCVMCSFTTTPSLLKPADRSIVPEAVVQHEAFKGDVQKILLCVVLYFPLPFLNAWFNVMLARMLKMAAVMNSSITWAYIW